MNQKPLLLIPFLLLAGCSKKEEKEAEAPAPVQVTAVTQDTIRASSRAMACCFRATRPG